MVGWVAGFSSSLGVMGSPTTGDGEEEKEGKGKRGSEMGRPSEEIRQPDRR